METKKKPLLQLSLKGIFGWLGLFIFISAWMFVLGIFVGRGTLPVRFDINQLQNDLAELRAEILKKEQEKNKEFEELLIKETDLNFHEDLIGTDQENSGRQYSQKSAPLKIKRRKVRPKAYFAAKRKNTLKTAATQKSNSTSKTGSKSSQIATTAPSSEKFTIQVAAFKNAKDADAYTAKLRKKGYPAYRVVGKQTENGVWYRVRVGTYNKKSDASDILSKLKKEKKGALVIATQK